MASIAQLDSVRQRIAGALGRTEGLALLLLRLSLAAVFAPTGWGKLHHLEKVTHYFVQLGIPFPHVSAVLVGGSELICGVLLLVGLVSRLATVPLIVDMVVAIVVAKRPDIGGVTDLFALDEFLYIVMALPILAWGAGSISLDALLGRIARASGALGTRRKGPLGPVPA